MIELHNVYKRHANGYESLKDVSFMVPHGQMLFVMGHSGAGKSTLLKLIASIDGASSGLIRINGNNLATISHRRLMFYRRQVGFIFQDHKLLFDRTVFDNVALPLSISGMRKEEITRRVRATLTKVGILSKIQMMPEVLSVGEQQRVCIARAVSHRPALILADEPTGNLDSDLSQEIIASLKQFNQLGTTVIVATHDQDLIYSSALRVLTLHQGQLIGDNGA